MRSKRRALRDLERRETADKGEPPINLVPFIDILTVLVLYLLVGSVYEHLAVLQLNLPSATATEKADKPPLQLTVTVRDQRLEVADGRNALRRIPNLKEGYDLAALAETLIQVKRRAPDETAVTLLLEPAISYDTLVQVMDTVRLWPAGAQPQGASPELFPNISIGDAPGASAPRQAQVPGASFSSQESRPGDNNSFSMTPAAAPSASAGGKNSVSMTPAAAPNPGAKS